MSESQANGRFLYFARVADIEEFPDVAGAVQRHPALVYASSTEPMDRRPPASRHRLPRATAVYWRPCSECWMT